MGACLAKNLVRSGHDVTVWNRTADKCRDVVLAGAKVASTPADVVAECDIIFSCVADPQAAKDVVFGQVGENLAKSADSRNLVSRCHGN
jgi:3-hydroxyisobutyrate dehydrogenase